MNLSHPSVLATLSAEELLLWAAEHFASRVALTCSFGGPGGLVMAHMVSRYAPEIPLIFIDTDFLFPETYAMRDLFVQQYGVKVQTFKSQITPDEQDVLYGERLWECDPDACCQLRKVEPMQRALAKIDAWICALRRDQSDTRSAVETVELHDTANARRIWKINPLAHWTRHQVWDYLVEHQVTLNPLWERGYASLGCIQCTRLTPPSHTERSGRWPGSSKKECGLHTFTQLIHDQPRDW